ncbi:MAG: BspA family leucine-rich repeat surface protein, partial [Bacilli bacterium]|nr:BspA family leucine-rich repeat surface protein [Bacilli bacterium]
MLYSPASNVYLNPDTSYMFSGFCAVTSIDTSKLNASKSTDMGKMFRYCRALTDLNISREIFNTTNVTNMVNMFDGCSSLTTIGVGSSNFNTSKVTDMSCMFQSCSNLTSLDVSQSNFDTRNVTDMHAMFSHCESLTELNVSNSNFNTSNVENMNAMFRGCRSLTSLDLTSPTFNTRKVTNMTYMFGDCYSLVSLDVSQSNFDTRNVTDMTGMFSGCSSITTLDVSKSNFNTNKVKSMGTMFKDCRNLQSIDVNNFDMTSCEQVGAMFGNCQKLTFIDLSGWNTSNIKYYSGVATVFGQSGRIDNKAGIFEGCDNLVEIDLTGWDTSSALEMQNMFYDCRKLEKVFASNSFVTTGLQKHSQMFQNCFKIVGGNGTEYDTEHLDKEYAWIDGRDGKPGYFWNRINYTITYDANAGGETVNYLPDPQIKPYGRTVNLSINTPSRANYAFDGWSLTPDGTTDYLRGAEFSTNADTTLYAVWLGDPHTITYHLGNGTTEEGSVILGTQDTAVGAHVVLYRFNEDLHGTFPAGGSSWSFAGWSTQPNGKTVEFTDGEIFVNTFDRDIDLYAVGQKEFIFNSGYAPTSIMNKQTQYWNPISMDTNNFTSIEIPRNENLATWTFRGYRDSDVASNTVTYAANTVGTNVTPAYNSSRIFRSIYKRTLTINYNANGGTGTTTASTAVQYYNSGRANESSRTNTGSNKTTPPFTLQQCAFTKANSVFDMWALGSATGTKFA